MARNVIQSAGIGGDARRKSRQRREALQERLTARQSRGPRRNDLLPDITLVRWPIGDLRAARRKVRKSDPAQVNRICNAIETLGFCAPLLIDADGAIIDGHERWEAAKQLSLTELPCIVVSHLTDEEIRVLRIALNRLPETGSWDFGALKLEFVELIELGAPIEVSGFAPPEIDLILGDEEVAPHEIGPLEPDLEAEAVAQFGDVWQLGDHLIVCGDSLETLVGERLFDDGRTAQLVLTDVPFNVPIGGHVTGGRHREFKMASGEMTREEFGEFNFAWFTLWLRFLVNGGLFATFIDWRSVELILGVGRSLGLALLNLPIWNKDNGGQGSLWRSQHEMVPFFKLGDAPHRNNIELGRHGRNRTNVWCYPGASSMGSDARKGLRHHPTVKPVALLEDALLDVTHRGDIVVDPFLGSGSTLIAAEKTGRICRGVEIDPVYVDVVIRRWMAVTGREPQLVGRLSDPPPRPPEAQQLLLPKPRVRTPATRREGD
jgi:DNA modification methylase